VICVSGNLIVSRELEFGRAFREAIGNFGNTKYFFNYFSVKKKKKPVPCGIGPYLQGKLWFIPLSLMKYKIWKAMLYEHWRHAIFEIKLWTLFVGWILTNLKEGTLHRLW
jgi:hypothetical protein